MSWQTGMTLTVTFIAALTDLRSGKVPNTLTYPAALLGLLLILLISPQDFAGSVAGLLGTLALYLLLHQFAGLGAGDAKLMAAVGALKGFSFALYASFYILCTGLIAGIAVLAWTGCLANSLRWVFRTLAGTVVPGLRPTPGSTRLHAMPFAPLIFVGIAWTTWLEYSGGPIVLQFWN